MNKKLIAIAIAAALAPAAAMADSGNVKISGNMHVSFDSLSDGTNRNNNVSSNNSNIVLSGDEDLGNGLKAIWKVSSALSMSGTGTNGADSTIGNQNTYLGLNGGFGTVLMGNHDTPFKLVGRSVDLFGDQIGDNRNLTRSATLNGGNAASSWDERANNVIAYATPDFSGFSAMLAYSTNFGQTGTTVSSSQTVPSTASTKVISLNGVYKSGPMMLGAAYEKHNVDNDAVVGLGPKDASAWRLAGGYNFGDFKVVALYQKESNNQFDVDSDRKVWGLGAAYNMGATTLKAQYYKAGDFGNNDNTGAKMFALGADYAMSKRTTAYVAYARTSNDDGGLYRMSAGGHGDTMATTVDGAGNGTDPSGISIGMKHAF